MTIGDWLQSRVPPPPPELMGGLERALGDALGEDAGQAATVLLRTAERMLRELISSGETGRPIAADLLTIDALTTYAVEAAAESTDDLPGFADEAMARFANAAQLGAAPLRPNE